jgi:hypothetical protein
VRPRTAPVSVGCLSGRYAKAMACGAGTHQRYLQNACEPASSPGVCVIWFPSQPEKISTVVGSGNRMGFTTAALEDPAGEDREGRLLSPVLSKKEGISLDFRGIRISLQTVGLTFCKVALVRPRTAPVRIGCWLGRHAKAMACGAGTHQRYLRNA